MLRVLNASRRIGEQTLFRNLDFAVPAGQCAAITGPNGAGKSSLLRCLIDDDLLDDGRILVDGTPPDDRSAAFRAAVAAELGEHASFYDLTLGEHLELLVATHRMDEPDVPAALADAGIEELRDRFPHTLSTGQRQRFFLAAALFRPARLIVLDEPERGLDMAGVQWLAARIRRACVAGSAVVMATHSLDLADRCADIRVQLGECKGWVQ